MACHGNAVDELHEPVGDDAARWGGGRARAHTRFERGIADRRDGERLACTPVRHKLDDIAVRDATDEADRDERLAEGGARPSKIATSGDAAGTQDRPSPVGHPPAFQPRPRKL